MSRTRWAGRGEADGAAEGDGSSTAGEGLATGATRDELAPQPVTSRSRHRPAKKFLATQ